MDTYQRVKKWLAAEFEIPEVFISPETTLGDIYLFGQRMSPDEEGRPYDSLLEGITPDSLDLVELMMSLEEVFGDMEIPEEEVKNISLFNKGTTVRQIVEFIDRYKSE